MRQRNKEVAENEEDHSCTEIGGLSKERYKNGRGSRPIGGEIRHISPATSQAIQSDELPFR